MAKLPALTNHFPCVFDVKRPSLGNCERGDMQVQAEPEFSGLGVFRLAQASGKCDHLALHNHPWLCDPSHDMSNKHRLGTGAAKTQS